jgi:hypothetical protein
MVNRPSISGLLAVLSVGLSAGVIGSGDNDTFTVSGSSSSSSIIVFSPDIERPQCG